MKPLDPIDPTASGTNSQETEPSAQPVQPPPIQPPSEQPQPGQPSTVQTAKAVTTIGQIRQQIARAVVGQEEVVEQLMAAMLAGGHVLLEGVPGVGKTLLALSLARTFGGKFARIQFTPDLMPSDVVGHSIFRPDTGTFEIRKGPAFTHLLLADEINRAPAKTQAALLEVMQEHQVSIEGQSFPLSGPFMTLATQNPLEHEGTYPLPEAQIDRFLLKILIDYPASAEDEVQIVQRVTRGQSDDRLDVDAVEQVITPEALEELQQVTGHLLVDERIIDYAVRIARRTRNWSGLRIGTGPRGAIALVRVARAFALLAGRGFVVPSDIKRAALPVLRHRIVVAAELEIAGQTPDQVLRTVIDDVEAPRQ